MSPRAAPPGMSEVAPIAVKSRRAVTRRWLLLCAVLSGLLPGAVAAEAAEAVEPQTAATAPVHSYRVKARYPHDPNAFTQGLVYDGGLLLESTGGYGESTLREVELRSGKVLRAVRLPPDVFGEGLTLWGGQLVQLTWRNQVGFVFDRESLRFKSQFRYATEGWGLTHDGQSLIMSDGSATLYFLDPESFTVRRSLQVRDGMTTVTQLNELEFIKGEIYANIWHSDRIARIAPDSGQVRGWIDLSGLRAPNARQDRDAVLNGIAYDAQSDRLFVTGKRWATLYEIEVTQ